MMNGAALQSKMSAEYGTLCSIEHTRHIITVIRGSVNFELVDVAWVC
jgi:hypothetical protein